MPILIPGLTDRVPSTRQRVATFPLLPSTPKLGVLPTSLEYPIGPTVNTPPTGKPPALSNRGKRSYWMYSDSLAEWVDIGYLVQSADWQHGEQQPNRIGSLMTPARGTIYLRDDDGYLSPTNFGGVLSSAPGASIEIRKGGDRTSELEFKGWSRGVLLQTTRNEPSFMAMPIYSGLTRLAEFGEGFAARIDGHPTIDRVIDLILDEMEWAGGRNLYPSDIQVYGTRLNRKDILDKGLRNRANFLQALRELVSLEGGRIYDTPDNAITFETFREPRGLRPAVEKVVRNPESVKTLDPDRLIINIIEESVDNWDSRGERQLTFSGIELPQQFVIEANSPDARIELYIAEEGNVDEEFVESVRPLVPNTHYTYTLTSHNGMPIVPRATIFSGGISISVPNPTSRPQTFLLVKVEGETFKRQWTARVGERRAPSILRYGPKNAVYRGDLVVDQAYMRARASYWLDAWSGIDKDGNPVPPLALEVRLKDPVDSYHISDLVRLEWASPTYKHTIDWPFWIDAVRVQTDGESTDVTLTLSDAYRKSLLVSEVVTYPADPLIPNSVPTTVRVQRRRVATFSLGADTTAIQRMRVASFDLMTAVRSRVATFNLTGQQRVRVGTFPLRFKIASFDLRTTFRQRVARFHFRQRVGHFPLRFRVASFVFPTKDRVATFPLKQRVARFALPVRVASFVFPVKERVASFALPQRVARFALRQKVASFNLPVFNISFGTPTFSNVTTNSFSVSATVSNPENESGTAYGRYRTGTGAWTDLPNRTVSVSTRNVSWDITGLMGSTAYEVQVAANGSFTQGLASATQTTAEPTYASAVSRLVISNVHRRIDRFGNWLGHVRMTVSYSVDTTPMPPSGTLPFIGGSPFIVAESNTILVGGFNAGGITLPGTKAGTATGTIEFRVNNVGSIPIRVGYMTGAEWRMYGSSTRGVGVTLAESNNVDYERTTLVIT